MATETTKRASVAKTVFHMTNGESGRSPEPGVERLEWTFANGATATTRLDQFPEEIRTLLAWHGMKQKLADAYAGTGGNADAAFEAFESMREQLVAGVWASDRATGPRIGDVAQAYFEALQTQGKVKKGSTVDQAREFLAANPDVLAKVRAVPAIKIRAGEIALERMRAGAGDGDVELPTF